MGMRTVGERTGVLITRAVGMIDVALAVGMLLVAAG
jgi:small neutral amino acid transporter SnatA (MarC family)